MRAFETHRGAVVFDHCALNTFDRPFDFALGQAGFVDAAAVNELRHGPLGQHLTLEAPHSRRLGDDDRFASILHHLVEYCGVAETLAECAVALAERQVHQRLREQGCNVAGVLEGAGQQVDRRHEVVLVDAYCREQVQCDAAQHAGPQHVDGGREQFLGAVGAACLKMVARGAHATRLCHPRARSPGRAVRRPRRGRHGTVRCRRRRPGRRGWPRRRSRRRVPDGGPSARAQTRWLPVPGAWHGDWWAPQACRRSAGGRRDRRLLRTSPSSRPIRMRTRSVRVAGSPGSS